MSKFIYSLNLAAYITMETGIEPELEMDYSGEGNGLVKCSFPECEGVKAAIHEYKADGKLHKFLQTYAELRDSIKEVRNQ